MSSTPEGPPLTDEQRAEQLAHRIREHLQEARRLASEAAQFALSHQHTEAVRRYLQLGKQLDFAERIRGHAVTADRKSYNFRKE